MIPTTADNRAHARYVRNIMRAWEAASPDQRKRGRAWYPTAHELADMLSEGNVPMGAGVIAALSAQKSWPENQRLAERCLVDGLIDSHFADALDKVRKIMSGVSPELVLPMDAKTGNFYRCINDPHDQEAVVIDRHAHDVAVGETYGNLDRGLSNGKRYATLAHAYREAARKLKQTPSVVQAVTWLWQSESYRPRRQRAA